MNLEYSDLDDLEELFNAKKERLNLLQKQEARYGSLSVPPQVKSEILELQREIKQIEIEYASRTILEEERTNTNPHSYSNQSDSENILPLLLKIFSIPIAFALILIFITIEAEGNKCPRDYCLDFEYSEGLGLWKSDGTAPTIINGQAYNRSDSVQIPASDRSIIYKQLGPSFTGERFKFTVWCKAPLATSCRIYVGTLETGLNPPIADSPRTMVRAGTGNWESLELNFTLQNDEDLYVFLYSEGEKNALLFSDLGFSKGR